MAHHNRYPRRQAYRYLAGMAKKHRRRMTHCVARINKMNGEELDRLVTVDRCPYEPQHLRRVPLGMFHCPVCGEMVVAGLHHPLQSNLDDYEPEPVPEWDNVEASHPFDI